MERDEGMRLRLLLTLAMTLQAQPCPPGVGAIVERVEVQAG